MNITGYEWLLDGQFEDPSPLSWPFTCQLWICLFLPMHPQPCVKRLCERHMYSHLGWKSTAKVTSPFMYFLQIAEQKKSQIKGSVTEIAPCHKFWPAEEYHQQYLEKGGRMGRGQSAAKQCNDPIRCYG